MIPRDLRWGDIRDHTQAANTKMSVLPKKRGKKEELRTNRRIFAARGSHGRNHRLFCSSSGAKVTLIILEKFPDLGEAASSVPLLI